MCTTGSLHLVPWIIVLIPFTQWILLHHLPPSIIMVLQKIFYSMYHVPARNAQGSGGSFKDRKPTGEVGCCDAWMAERTCWWIERALRPWLCLSVSLSFYVIAFLFTVSICLLNYLSISVSIYLIWSYSIYYSNVYLLQHSHLLFRTILI